MRKKRELLFEDLADRIDWDLLHKQRLDVVQALLSRRIDPHSDLGQSVTGIIHLLDDLTDQANEAGIWYYPEYHSEE